MIEEEFDVVDRDSEIETLHGACAHIDDADDLASVVKEWAAGVTGVDCGIDLEEDFPGEIPARVADDAFRDRTFETQGVPDHENFFAYGYVIVWAEDHGAGQLADIFFDLQDREVLEGGEGDDAYVFMNDIFQFIFAFFETGDIDMFLSLDDVKVGDDVSLFINNEPGPQAAGGADDHH